MCSVGDRFSSALFHTIGLLDELGIPANFFIPICTHCTPEPLVTLLYYPLAR